MNGETEHYFTQHPTSELNTYFVSYNFGKYSFRLKTADGVFSKRGVDFGSDLLIRTVASESPPESLLDIGCGYGVIGISLSKIFECKAVLCDINERAVQLAKENAAGTKAEVLQSNGLENIEGKFDMIVTNPPIRAGKGVYHGWFSVSPEYLNDGGRLYTVIQKKQGAPSAITHLKGIFSECEVIKRDKGYYIIKCTK
ncbi:MAG: class I SAM-dependent methyltransferase [Clostridia bacterium]|nr:class I SAM-dependent methyltransferase [Clostridia bacterium]